MTSSLPVADLKGNIFRRHIHPPNVIVIALMLSELSGETESPLPASPPPPTPPSKEDEKNSV